MCKLWLSLTKKALVVIIAAKGELRSDAKTITSSRIDLVIGNQQKKDMCSRWNKQFPNNMNENRWHPPVVNDCVKLKLMTRRKWVKVQREGTSFKSTTSAPNNIGITRVLTITPPQHHMWPWVLGANHASHWAESSWRIVAVGQSWWWNMRTFLFSRSVWMVNTTTKV